MSHYSDHPDTPPPVCEFQRHMRGIQLDADFDGGEFSSGYHEDALDGLEPCGTCYSCLVNAVLGHDHEGILLTEIIRLFVNTSADPEAAMHLLHGAVKAGDPRRTALPFQLKVLVSEAERLADVLYGAALGAFPSRAPAAMEEHLKLARELLVDLETAAENRVEIAFEDYPRLIPVVVARLRAAIASYEALR